MRFFKQLVSIGIGLSMGALVAGPAFSESDRGNGRIKRAPGIDIEQSESAPNLSGGTSLGTCVGVVRSPSCPNFGAFGTNYGNDLIGAKKGRQGKGFFQKVRELWEELTSIH